MYFRYQSIYKVLLVNREKKRKGEKIIENIRKKYDFEVEVLSGHDEGITTSIGVLHFMKKIENLPNYIVLLDSGVVVNLNKKRYDEGKIRINIYPEYETEENFWALIELDSENSVLIYQYLLLLEHLNNTIVGTPEVLKYTQELFDFSLSNIHKL